MERRTNARTAQLALDLTRDATALPTAQDTTVLLQALADLLLGALGEQVEAPLSPTQNQGVSDEPEDHA